MMRRVLALVLAIAGGASAEPALEAGDAAPGRRYVYRLPRGGRRVVEVTARTAEEVVARIRTSQGEREVAVLESARFPLARSRTIATVDTVVVSGVVFPCAVHEASAGGALVRTWVSTRFPETLRVEVGTEVAAELVEVSGP